MSVPREGYSTTPYRSTRDSLRSPYSYLTLIDNLSLFTNEELELSPMRNKRHLVNSMAPFAREGGENVGFDLIEKAFRGKKRGGDKKCEVVSYGGIRPW